jgi:hypothetical protein
VLWQATLINLLASPLEEKPLHGSTWLARCLRPSI